MLQSQEESVLVVSAQAPLVGPAPADALPSHRAGWRIPDRRWVFVVPWVGLAWLAALGLFVAALVGVARWAAPAQAPVIVTVDGHTGEIRTARPTVGALLADLGVELRPEDRLTPSAETAIASGLQVRIERARPYWIEADGARRTVYSHAATVGVLAGEIGLKLKPADEVYIRNLQVGLDTPLRSSSPASGRAVLPSRPWESAPAQPLHVTVRRSVPVTVDDGTVPYTIYTTAPTIGEALHASGLTLYLGDHVEPALGTPVRSGLRVHIDRSRSVLVTADGRTVRTRTTGDRVGDALVDLGVYVGGSDRVEPALDRAVADNMAIAITRVRDAVAVEREIIPYESIMVADTELELDQQRLAQQGEDGEFRRRYRLVYEDGVEVSRDLIDAWVAAEPVTRVTAYGKKLVSRPLDTPEGPVTYWRKVRMYATSYSPARSGTPKTAPWYGRTRLGMTLRKGIVAVDPSVIPMKSYVYVPGYGIAIAGDTGGGVRGKWIDLGFEDHNYESWHRWVDVYVLDPLPAPNQIRWILPNYPPPGFPRNR
jgi:uncharacterized protein YabE (DUF348 family)